MMQGGHDVTDVQTQDQGDPKSMRHVTLRVAGEAQGLEEETERKMQQ